jgi:hypothetical protein
MERKSQRMPKAQWGVSARDVGNFDRDSAYKPYQGPIPVNGVYAWRVAKAVFAASDGESNAQLRLTLVLSPRNKGEQKYNGYVNTAFMPIADNTQFRYVPFLMAIGASDTDFVNRTITDTEGVIKSIGKWKSDGKTIVAARLVDNDYEGARNPKQIDWVGELEDATPDEDEDEEEYEDEEEEDEDSEEEYEEDEEEEEEPEPPRKARRAPPAKRTPARRGRR